MNIKLKTVMWSAMLATGVMLAPALRAQDAAGTEKPKKERKEGGPRGGMSIERLKEALGLTEAQVEQLKPILAAQREEMTALRKEAGPDADRAAMGEKMKAIRDKYKAKIEAVLTEEQKAKFAELQAKGPRGPGGPGGQGGQGTGTPPPPPES